MCPIVREKRFEREDHWMKTLRIKHPVGLPFLLISRGAARTERLRT